MAAGTAAEHALEQQLVQPFAHPFLAPKAIQVAGRVHQSAADGLLDMGGGPVFGAALTVLQDARQARQVSRVAALKHAQHLGVAGDGVLQQVGEVGFGVGIGLEGVAVRIYTGKRTPARQLDGMRDTAERAAPGSANSAWRRRDGCTGECGSSGKLPGAGIRWQRNPGGRARAVRGAIFPIFSALNCT